MEGEGIFQQEQAQKPAYEDVVCVLAFSLTRAHRRAPCCSGGAGMGAVRCLESCASPRVNVRSGAGSIYRAVPVSVHCLTPHFRSRTTNPVCLYTRTQATQ